MSFKFQNSEHKNNLEKPLRFYRLGLRAQIQFQSSSFSSFSETLELSFEDLSIRT